ncbi:MAG: hypothetical protein HC892_19875 [Saprospiraceae bacterium]|nr:hypothetical protein [Saprospiraceae bacterium]
MPIWLEVIIQLIQSVVPALVVFFTVQTLLKQYLSSQYQLKQLELKNKDIDTTLPLRLQAYERLSLYCERISIPNLLLRLRSESMSNSQLKNALLIAIQQEYEHNTTQQIYVSDTLWKIVQFARDEVVQVITGIAETIEPSGNAKELATALLNYLASQPTLGFEKAQLAIKKEVQTLF